MAREVSVRIKFFSGIDRELDLQNYDPASGVAMTLRSGTRLRRALRSIGVTDLSRNIYFRNGTRISVWAKLGEGDEVSCLRASGGG
ncbi:MAG: hypothetical protein JW838_02280 [Spirochaetes bacterium]|nr:hypothetical protein [Spirochaetota bacterium]